MAGKDSPPTGAVPAGPDASGRPGVSGVAGEGRAALLYDRECGFCRWSLGVVLAWDRRGRLRGVALQDPEAETLLADLDREQRMASWHLVAPDGSRSSAGAALAPLLRLLPRGGPAASLAERFPALAEAGYRAVADHRVGLHRLIRIFGAS
jgi:predicted DCC family thiol-disulfide oxidoreductase YuxK